jgi:glucose-1-phosphate adenylyltransferase
MEGQQFGVMGVDAEGWVQRFDEKPREPFSIPGDPTRCLASMGVYVFNARVLFEELCRDATVQTSNHDFGKDLIPSLIRTHKVFAYAFRDKKTGDTAYWRDVGTLDAFYEANMDLVSVNPQLNLYEQTWPIRGWHPPLPPPKFVFAQFDGHPPRVGQALDSMVCPGSIISGGRVKGSIVGCNVRVNSWASVDDSILFEGVEIRRHAKVRRAIIDKGVVIPEGMQVGYHREQDLARGLVLTDNGVTVIGMEADLS